MENKSNSINVGKQKKRIIYCDKKVAQLLGGSSCTLLNIELTTKRSLAQLCFNYKNSNSIEVSSESTDSFTVSNTIESLTLILSLLKDEDYQSNNRETSLYKDVESEVKKLFKNCDSLELLLENFSSGKLLKGFKNSQILLHEKGKPQAKSLYCIDSSKLTKTDISVGLYNQIYSKIKKSKNKLFDQTDILSSEIKVVGSFLAKEIDLPTHTLVIILSRGDFFSPSIQEREHFNKILLLSTSELYKIINKSTINEKTLRVNELIENSPFYIKVSNQSLDIESNFTKPVNVVTKLISDIEIEFDTLESFQSDPDFFHHERLILMGELLNTLRHELSNPLFGLNISTNLLLTDSYEKDVQITQTIEEIGKSSERCQKIIENFAGLYGDRNIYQNIKIESLINETLTLTKSESRLFKKKVSVSSQCKELNIHTNPTLLSQIIFNLVINSSQALRAHDSSDKTIEITTQKENDFINIYVIDNGPGVPKNKVSKIFEAFYTTKASGTGLGLAICHNLAQKLGGEIKYINQSNGAKFKVSIPIGYNEQ